MFFKDHLYTILSAEMLEKTASFQMRLNAGHTIFSAHFPGMPILPGACIVQIVAELVTLWKCSERVETLPVVKMSNLKFLTVISPNEVTDLEVSLEEMAHENGLLKISAQVRDAQKVFAKMTLTFADI